MGDLISYINVAFSVVKHQRLNLEVMDKLKLNNSNLNKQHPREISHGLFKEDGGMYGHDMESYGAGSKS